MNEATPPGWWIDMWHNMGRYNQLWDRELWDAGQARNEGWAIALRTEVVARPGSFTRRPERFLIVARNWPNDRPRAADLLGGVPLVESPNMELFVLMQAHTGSEYHKLALKVLQRGNAAIAAQKWRTS